VNFPGEGTRRLIEALEQLGASVPRDDLLRRARANEFHDFKSPHANPCTVLVHALRRAGADFVPLSHRAMRGDFDEAPDAEDEAELEGLLLEAGLSPRRRGSS
jgi:hypothetical protein